MDSHGFGDWAGLEQRLRAHVAALAASPRPPGSAEHRAAREYIGAHLGRAGFEVEAVSYASGLNLLTAPIPADDALPLVIVGAHYDSIPGSPGADDNASAVAALLELAAWVGPRLAPGRPPAARLVLAAYDEEEYGLLGSNHHSGQVRSPVKGMISLEMLGYTDRRPGSQHLPPHLKGLYPDVGDFIGVVGNEASRPLLEAVTSGLKRVEGLPVQSLAVPGDGTPLPVSRLSDHASFWDRGLPALMVTDTSFFRNPHYHEPTDAPDTLDYPFLARVTAGVCLAIWDLLT
jgi:Zn-dependent M28 family amino/carboxypeptidase